MKSQRQTLAIITILLFCTACYAQEPRTQGSTWLTPRGNLQLQSKPLIVPEKFRSVITTNRQLNVPPGYSVRVFYAGRELDKPRFMTWSPDSVLCIADMNGGFVLALPDRNRDGVADTATRIATGVYAHDVKFYRGALYAAEERRVLKFEDKNGDGIYETRSVFIDGIASNAPTGGHQTRTIVFDAERRKMYLSIGSLCNVCREDYRAIIEEWNDDGTGRRTFATGLRNAVGLTQHPRTGKLWTNNNGSDWQGNDIPPEWIDIVRDGGFYGYPFAHSYQMYFNYAAGSADYRALLPITAADTARIRTMIPPAALITAHSAPMALKFSNASFPEHLRRGAFMALRGSWNRTPLTGYKIVYLDFDDDRDTVANTVSDVLTGFLTDSVRSVRWARPVGLEVDVRGNLYVGSDDITPAIFILSPDTPNNIRGNNQNSAPSRFRASIMPNPCTSSTTLSLHLAKSGSVSVQLYSALGGYLSARTREQALPAGEHQLPVSTAGLPAGVYFCRVSASEALSEVLPLVIMP